MIGVFCRPRVDAYLMASSPFVNPLPYGRAARTSPLPLVPRESPSPFSRAAPPLSF